MGASGRSRWAELTRGSVINRAIRQSGPIDVHVISTDLTTGTAASAQGSRPARPVPRSSRARTIAWLVAFVAIPLIVLALLPFRDAIGVPGMLLVLLLAPVGVALLGGLAPALAASAVAFILADWFYIEPTHSLRFAHAGDALALVVFVAVSALVSSLVDRLARRSVQLARSQAETETLAELASGTALLDAEALHRLVTELHLALGLDAVAVLAPTATAGGSRRPPDEPVPATPEGASYSAELAGGSMLVVSGPSLAAEDRRLLSAFVAQLRARAGDAAPAGRGARRPPASPRRTDVREALLAAVSHDLRGPLANIKAAATSLLSEDVDWPPDEVRSFCKTIDAEADRLHSVISNLLDMGRVQAGMLGVRMSTVAVDEVVYAALASLSVDVSAVDVDVPHDLPAVSADPALLERALANVVLERAQLGTGGHPGASRSGCRRRAESTSGSSTGAPASHATSATWCSSRSSVSATAAARPTTAIGLGLAVTKGFVEAMGGEVVIEDTPGRRRHDRDQPGGGDVSRVLVVDDDLRILKTLEVNLRGRGYDVDLARTGEEALQLAARRHPDAVILDLGLPSMDGLDVVRGLRGWTSVPIVVLSGRGAEAAKVEALDLGADDYLTKPFGMDELFARLRAAVRRAVLPEGQAVLTTPDFTIDFTAKQVHRGDELVRLTPTQWHIVEVLVRNAGRSSPTSSSCTRSGDRPTARRPTTCGSS